MPVFVLLIRATTFSSPAHHTFLTLEPVKPFIQFSRRFWSVYESGVVLRTNLRLCFSLILEALRSACSGPACLHCLFTLLSRPPIQLFRLRELCDGERLFQADFLPPVASWCCFTAALLYPSVCAHICRCQTVFPCLGVGRLLGGKRDRRKGEEERGH